MTGVYMGGQGTRLRDPSSSPGISSAAAILEPCWFEYVTEKTVPVGGGAVSSFDLGSYDGEDVKELMLRFWINNAQGGSSRDFKIYPNGAKGVATSAIANQTGTSGSEQTRDSLCPIAFTVRERFSGIIRLQTELSPAGITLFDRRYEGFTTLGDDPLTEGSTGFFRSNGWWDRSDGALTSLSLVATGADNDTLQPAIGEGTHVEIWKLKEE